MKFENPSPEETSEDESELYKTREIEAPDWWKRRGIEKISYNISERNGEYYVYQHLESAKGEKMDVVGMGETARNFPTLEAAKEYADGKIEELERENT